MAPGSGQLLADGRYRLDAEIGRGGMGTVYLAHDLRLDAVRAIKVIKHRGAARLEQEARAMARVQHPNLVTVFDVGTTDGSPWLVMELVRGGNLAERNRRLGPLPPRLAAQLMIGALDGLQAAHDAGIVHRDLKPANILLTVAGQPRLTDFGIARTDDAALTQSGAVLGTLAYMAPEQHDDPRSVDVRTDVYGAGATLCALCTATSPADLHNPSSHPTRMRDIPEELGAVIAQACRYDPAERYATATELAAALAETLDKLPADPPDTVLVDSHAVLDPTVLVPWDHSGNETFDLEPVAPPQVLSPASPRPSLALRPEQHAGTIHRQWRRIPRGFRLAIGTSIPFGVGMASIALMLGSSLPSAVASGLVAGLAYGLLMTLSIGLAHVVGISAGGASLPELRSCEQTLRLTLRATATQVWPVVVSSVETLGVRTTVLSTPGVELLVETGWSVWSAGEVVHVTMSSDAPFVLLQLHSRPRIPTTLVDYGVNRRNLQTIADHLMDAFAVDIEEPSEGLEVLGDQGDEVPSGDDVHRTP